MLALVPQILGHSAFNWALGHFRSLLVTVALLFSDLGGTSAAAAPVAAPAVAPAVAAKNNPNRPNPEWVVPPGSDDEVLALADSFFAAFSEGGFSAAFSPSSLRLPATAVGDFER